MRVVFSQFKVRKFIRVDENMYTSKVAWFVESVFVWGALGAMILLAFQSLAVVAPDLHAFMYKNIQNLYSHECMNLYKMEEKDMLEEKAFYM